VQRLFFAWRVPLDGKTGCFHYHIPVAGVNRKIQELLIDSRKKHARMILRALPKQEKLSFL
jgi:hypothetical protein